MKILIEPENFDLYWAARFGTMVYLQEGKPVPPIAW